MLSRPFLLSALSLSVCKAAVLWLSMSPPTNHDTDHSLGTDAGTVETKVYCDPNTNVVYCHKHSEPKEYYMSDAGRSFLGTSTAEIHRGATSCSLAEPPPIDENTAFMVMDSCTDVGKLSINNRGDVLEVPLANGEWEYCAPIGCYKHAQGQILGKTTWTEQTRKNQAKRGSQSNDVTPGGSNAGKKAKRGSHSNDVTPDGSNAGKKAIRGSKSKGSTPGGSGEKKQAKVGAISVFDDGPYGNSNIPKLKPGSTVKRDDSFGVSPSESLKSSSLGSKGPKLMVGTECDRAYSCLSCSTGRICAPKRDEPTLYEVGRFVCTDVFPYCNYTSGTCSSSPDAACIDLPDSIASDNFLCMRDGYYPDPLSCERFFSCKNKIAYEHFCPYYPTPYYHPGLKFCVASNEFCTDLTSSHRCTKMHNFGRKVPILFTPNYFLVCGVNSNVLSVDRCIGAYVFDASLMKCVFVCPHEGLFANVDDCSKYMKCTRRPQGGFRVQEMKCPHGQGFLDSEFNCVDRRLVNNCKQLYPDMFSKK